LIITTRSGKSQWTELYSTHSKSQWVENFLIALPDLSDQLQTMIQERFCNSRTVLKHRQELSQINYKRGISSSLPVTCWSRDQTGHRLVNDQTGHRLVSDQTGHRLVSDQVGHRLVSDQVGHRLVSDQTGHKDRS
jgi:hypothetical protein